VTSTPTDQDFWDQIPSIADSIPPQVVSAGKPRAASRRGTLKAIGALGRALALNVLSWLPPSLRRSANATVGTEYPHCAGYDEWPGYDDSSETCVGDPYSQGYCGDDGWFLQYSEGSFASQPVAICGQGYPVMNAWRWTHSGTPYRCADGMLYWRDMIHWRNGSAFRICSWPNP
jgi:hypothetical protein